jgi:hypothetical protein
MSRDNELCIYLTQSGTTSVRLDATSSAAAERAWREIYGGAFAGRPRLRTGAKAEHEYRQQVCTHYLIVPFTSNVEGLPVQVLGSEIGAYDCSGSLVPLGAFHTAEFFVCPIDFSWTMVHTHEDHGCAGPFFIRREWLP